MCSDDFLCYCQAETSAGWLVGDKGCKDFLYLFPGHPASVICHRDTDTIINSCQADSNSAPWCCYGFAGIPEEILKAHPDTCVRIPMIGETRSLNLSNSVAIVLYEALRQQGFAQMKTEGELHRLHW